MLATSLRHWQDPPHQIYPHPSPPHQHEKRWALSTHQRARTSWPRTSDRFLSNPSSLWAAGCKARGPLWSEQESCRGPRGAAAHTTAEAGSGYLTSGQPAALTLLWPLPRTWPRSSAPSSWRRRHPWSRCPRIPRASERAPRPPPLPGEPYRA